MSSDPDQEIIEEMLVPGTRGIFFLGCFERRVTFYSQQVRALNLAHGLLARNVVRPNGRVGIIGGGLAGVTLAAALAKAAPELSVVVFERRSQLLDLQRGARDRYVHPHIFDWPEADANEVDAKLPLMNWTAGSASDVAAQIEAQFDVLRRHGKVEVTLNQAVANIREVHDIAQVSVAGVACPERFDAIVLSIGFGYENCLSQANTSYWSPSLFPAPFILNKTSPTSIFISGNGDGGLADFALAAFNGLSHIEILELVTKHPQVEALAPLLLELDELAWKYPTTDLYRLYSDQVLKQLPDGLLRNVIDKFRKNTRIVIHTQDTTLFRPATAILSRLITFLAIVADRLYEQHHIEVWTGSKLVGTSIEHGPIVDDIGRCVDPDYRMFRFGPDKESNLAPFSDLAQRYLDVHRDRLKRRPETPRLTAAAQKRWRDHGNLPLAPRTAVAQPTTADAPLPGKSTSQINVVHGSIGAGAVVIQSFSNDNR